MDLTWSADQQAFRSELRAWIDEHRFWDPADGPPSLDDLDEEVRALRRWQRQLADGGWVAVAWPEAFGGRGLGAAEHYLVQEELARANAPELVGRIGVNLAGPTLLAHGTEAQKSRWLPHILTADELWCQLFSEPDAGSDLASLRTRAERADGGWRLYGQKVWTSYAQFADWGLCLARTDPDARKHHGITYLVVEMDQPGVEVRPLVQITDEAEFNEVHFDGAYVPDDQLIGEVDGGWQVTRSTLSHERGTSPRQLVKHLQLVEELLRLAIENASIDDPRIEQRVAQSYADIRIFQLHNWRTISRLSKGQEPGPEGSLLKLYWSERSQQLHDTLLEVLGDDAVLWKGADGHPGGGRYQRSWLYYRAARIFAGTSEIQRNVIGERLLGLPREPRPKVQT